MAPFVESSSVYGLTRHSRYIQRTVESIKDSDLVTVFYPNDRVAIVSGDYAPFNGPIKEIFDEDFAVVILKVMDAEDSAAKPPKEVIVSVKEDGRVFAVGDHVRVHQGAHVG